MRQVIACCLLAVLPALPVRSQEEPAEEVEAVPHGKLTLTLDPGGHTERIGRVLFTPDSKHLVTLSHDHTVRVWDVQTGRTVRTLQVPGAGALSVAALTPDGKLLAVAADYPEKDKLTPFIYLLRFPEGTVERVLRGHRFRVTSLVLSADGKRLASGSLGRVLVWDLEKESAPAQIPWSGPLSLAFSPDGKQLAVQGALAAGDSPKRTAVLDLATRKEVVVLPVPREGHRTVLWSADGKTLFTHGDRAVQMWGLDGKLRGQIPVRGTTPMVLGPDSQSVLVAWSAPGGGSKHIASLFDVATGKEKARLEKRSAAPCWDVALSPDGRLAATASDGWRSEVQHSAFLWRVADGQLLHRLGVESWLQGNKDTVRPAWSPDGKAVAWSSRPDTPTFHFSDLRLGPPLARKDARGAIEAQGGISLEREAFDTMKVVKDGKVLATLGPGARLPNGVTNITCATLVGKDRVALGGKGGGLALFDIQTGKLVRRYQRSGLAVKAVAPSPDARRLLTVGDDQKLRVFHVEKERPLLTMYKHGGDWVIWTEEGYYAATPGGEKLIGWRVDNGLDQAPAYYPAERFRKRLYRPDVIDKVLELGSVEEALKALDGAAARPADLERLLPPAATLKVVAQEGAEVTVEATALEQARGQPVLSLRLLLDGRPFPDLDPETFGKGRPRATKRWTVQLPPGEHALSLLARSEDAAALSAAVLVRHLAAPRPVLHLLAVGIDGYKNGLPPLKSAARDARELASAFALAKQGGLYRDVQVRTLLDGKATLAALRSELEGLRERAGREDVVVLSFAGHGVSEGGEFYLLAADSDPKDLKGTALPGRELARRLRDLRCPVLLLLDGWHSGARPRGLRPGTEEAARALSDEEVGAAVLAAAMGHQEALGESEGGYFAAAVKEALAGAPGVPRSAWDGRLYLHHLYAHVLDSVGQRSGQKQHPFLRLPEGAPPLALRQLPTP